MSGVLPKAKTFKSLQYTIAYCSGEDTDHPALELLHSGPNNKGWESPRFGSFPQIIVLQFKGLVVLKQIQFLSHQAKIASKIELFAYAPTSTISLPPPTELSTLKFKRIGYLSLDSNERSGFTARELKSVYIEVPALYLKVVFHKCHVNKHNIFNQVGVVAINCLGDSVDAAEKEQEAPQIGQLIEEASSYDATTLEKLKMLNGAKEKAVEQEDFDEAKRIKEIMDKLKSIGKQLSALEQKKKLAINNEDYESAKILKVEIDRLRGSAFEDRGSTPSNPLATGSKGKESEYIPISQDYVLEDQKNPDLPTGHDKVLREIKPLRPPGLGFGVPEEVKGQEMPALEPRPTSGIVIDKDKAEKLRESIVVPAVKNQGKKPPVQEYDESAIPEEGGAPKSKELIKEKAEPLAGQAKKLAEPYFTLFELSLLEMLFSKNWNLRESGLDIIKSELASKEFHNITMDDEEKIMVTLVGLMSHLITDKVSQVSMKAMGIVDAALKFFPYELQNHKSTYNANVDSCVLALMEKIGDNNQKVRAKAEETCLGIGTQGRVSLSSLIIPITKSGGASSGAKKPPSSTKHLQGKMNLLAELIRHFGIESKSPTSQAIIDYALAGVKNNTAEVRNAAYSLLVEVYKLIGGKINGYLEELRPAQKDMLQAEFDKVGGGSGPGPAPEAEKPKVSVTTNIAPQGGSKSKPTILKNVGALEKEDPAEPEEGELPSSPAPLEKSQVCDYCGKYDQTFTQDSLDMHCFRECPMLYLCQACGNVVEIMSINSHLLKECTSKDAYSECQICHEAILSDELDQHVEEGACKPFDPAEAIRCPLCHMDIKPATMDMWRDHILVKQCPNNERRPL